MAKHFVILASLVFSAGFVHSLRYEDEDEGACLNIPPASNINSTWLANTMFPYNAGGSKYHLYRFLSESFSDLREFEFYYDLCLQSTLRVPTESGSVNAFGKWLPFTFVVRPVSSLPNTFDFSSLPVPENGEVTRHTIVLTDNKSFIVFSTCYRDTNKRAWTVEATTPNLDENTKALIKHYLTSVGFSMEKFAFFNFDTCNLNQGKSAEKIRDASHLYSTTSSSNNPKRRLERIIL